MDLQFKFLYLTQLLPKAIYWAEKEAFDGRNRGRQLTLQEFDIAQKVGVAFPRQIRLITVETLPMPTDPLLRAAAEERGFLDPGMIGLTLGYSVFICSGHESPRVLSHEFRHVNQYEQAGSIAAFLTDYLLQILERGYDEAEAEIDARAHELID